MNTILEAWRERDHDDLASRKAAEMAAASLLD